MIKTNLRNTTFVTVVLMSMGLSSCFLTAKSPQNLNTNPPIGLTGNGTVGIMHVDQAAKAMTTVTGLSMTSQVPALGGGTQTVAAAYTTLLPFMSPNGQVNAINSPMLLTLTGLAGNICTTWLSNEASKESTKAGSSMANSGVNFNSGPSGITPAISVNILNNYGKLFWGRVPTAAEAAVLSTAITEATSEVGTAGSTGTQQVLLVPCTAFLSSPAFLSS